MKKIFIKLIKGYQKIVSPLIGKHCRFYPSCSEYIIETIEKQGLFKGIIKGCKRILKCHPLHQGGIDLPCQ